MILLRRANASDLPALLRLSAEIQQHHVDGEPDVYRPTDPTEIEAWYAAKLAEDAWFWLAEDAGEVLGAVLLVRVDRPANPFTWGRSWLLVDQLVVLKSAQRRGVGRLLMEHAASEAARLGLARLELDVRSFNGGAIRFYEELGYKPTGVRMVRVS